MMDNHQFVRPIFFAFIIEKGPAESGGHMNPVIHYTDTIEFSLTNFAGYYWQRTFMNNFFHTLLYGFPSTAINRPYYFPLYLYAFFIPSISI